MKIAYFDCSAGISGDMCLGALVDAGASLSEIESALKGIQLSGYSLTSEKVTRAGISATKVDVELKESEVRSRKSEEKQRSEIAAKHSHEIRRWKDIQQLITASSLKESIKQKGLEIFKTLFMAEGKVHAESFDSVHLHELGATDCVVDIFGTLIGLDLLGIEKVYVSPVNLGSGTVHTAHGLLPVPAPATAELLRGFPVYASGIPFELTTPTGAVILKSVAIPAVSHPLMTVGHIGYGAGNKDFAAMPNTLRIMIGDEVSAESGNSVLILETNIDDMNPQIYESVMARLFEAGALDVYLENIIMKKGRPAIKLTVIINEADAEKIADLLFEETTTIGIRMFRAERKVLDREIKKMKTSYGDVRFKISRIKGKIVTAAPEYEDLKAISERTKLPIKKIAEEISKIRPSDSE